MSTQEKLRQYIVIRVDAYTPLSVVDKLKIKLLGMLLPKQIIIESVSVIKEDTK